MSNAARETADGLHLLSLPKLFLGASQRGLGQATNRQIAHDLGDTNHRPRGVSDGRHGQSDLDHRAVLPPARRLVLSDSLATRGRCADAALVVERGRRREQGHRLSEHFVCAITEEPLRAQIPTRDLTVQRRAQDRVVRRLDDRG